MEKIIYIHLCQFNNEQVKTYTPNNEISKT